MIAKNAGKRSQPRYSRLKSMQQLINPQACVFAGVLRTQNVIKAANVAVAFTTKTSCMTDMRVMLYCRLFFSSHRPKPFWNDQTRWVISFRM